MITKPDGAALTPAEPGLTLRLTLYALDEAQTIINGLDDTNILNAGRGTLSSLGELVIGLMDADNPIVDPHARAGAAPHADSGGLGQRRRREPRGPVHRGEPQRGAIKICRARGVSRALHVDGSAPVSRADDAARARPVSVPRALITPTGIRITNMQRDLGRDALQPCGMAYWPGLNAHQGEPSLRVFLVHGPESRRAGAGLLQRQQDDRAPSTART